LLVFPFHNYKNSFGWTLRNLHLAVGRFGLWVSLFFGAILFRFIVIVAKQLFLILGPWNREEEKRGATSADGIVAVEGVILQTTGWHALDGDDDSILFVCPAYICCFFFQISPTTIRIEFHLFTALFCSFLLLIFMA